MPHEAMSDPHAVANGYVVDLHHPMFGTYRASGMPFQMEKSDATVPGPSPAFAADTTAVMHELGLDEALVAQLLGAGVIIAADS